MVLKSCLRYAGPGLVLGFAAFDEPILERAVVGLSRILALAFARRLEPQARRSFKSRARRFLVIPQSDDVGNGGSACGDAAAACAFRASDTAHRLAVTGNSP